MAYTPYVSGNGNLVINFGEGITASAYASITAALQAIEGSPSAAALFSSPKQVEVVNNNRFAANDGLVGINEASIGAMEYFSAVDGSKHSVTFERAFIHELVHAVLGKSDLEYDGQPYDPAEDGVDPLIAMLSDGSADFLGDTVRYTNEIMQAVYGEQPRSHYLNVNFVPQLSGISTFGHAIDQTIFGALATPRNLTIDRSGAAENALIIGGDGNEKIIAGDGIDSVYGGGGSDILVGGIASESELVAPNFTTPNTSWDDGVTDYLSGGGGNDTYLIYSNRTYFGGPSSDSYVANAFNNEIDFIDGKDTNFDAYFQFSYDGSTKVAHVTAQHLKDATEEDGVYDLGVVVSFFYQGQTVEQTVKGSLHGTSLLLTISFPGNEEIAILGGVYDFISSGDPDDPTDPTDPIDPTNPGDTGWLGVDDLTTASVGGPILINPIANDSYPQATQADTLVALNVSHGTLAKNGSAYTYTPTQGFTGVDTFRYHISDEDGAVKTSKTALNVIVVGDDIAQVIGTDSDESLVGGGQKDVLWGKLGDDTLLGGAGSDTYIYSKDDGNDYIDDEAGSTTDVDVLRFTDLNLSEVTFTQDSVNSVLIEVDSTGDIVTLDEQSYAANEGWGLERIEFANGVSIDLTHSRDEAWTYNGTNGNDSITGAIWGQKEIFIGGKGDDYLNGEAGSDTYIYSSGDGSDLIDDEAGFSNEVNVDVLIFNDLNAADVSFSRVGVDLKILVTATGDVITVDEQFYSDVDYWGVEEIKFANGSIMDRDDILAFV